MLLKLLDNATVANGGLFGMPNVSILSNLKEFQGKVSPEKKLRCAGPNGSGAWQRTILVCATSRTTVELIAKVVLTNTNPQAAPQVVVDPSSLWFAFSPGDGTFVIGEQSVTISGDTAIDATGATNGLTGIACSVEAT